MKARLVVVLGLVNQSVVACEPFTDSSCDICTTSAVVRGTVTADSGGVPNVGYATV